MVKKTSKNVCTIPLVVTPDPSSPVPSTSLAVETPEDKEEDPEPADGDIQME
jgi:hypothetical protein